MPEPSERSEAGVPIYRYQEPVGDDAPVGGDPDLINAVTAHIEKHLGPVEQVFHEIVSPTVHVDIYWVAPSRSLPYHTLVTSGMSERPMSVPADMDEWAFAELMVTLPASWPLTMEAWEEEKNYWPLRWLKTLARFPHEHGSWLGDGHTVPNGDPPERFAPSTRLCGMMLVPPVSYPERFSALEVSPGRTIHFWSLMPLYGEEMELKLKEGIDALLERLDAEGIKEVIDPARKNVAQRRRWWFG
jgi:hypothetical protein